MQIRCWEILDVRWAGIVAVVLLLPLTTGVHPNKTKMTIDKAWRLHWHCHKRVGELKQKVAALIGQYSTAGGCGEPPPSGICVSPGASK